MGKILKQDGGREEARMNLVRMTWKEKRDKPPR